MKETVIEILIFIVNLVLSIIASILVTALGYWLLQLIFS